VEVVNYRHVSGEIPQVHVGRASSSVPQPTWTQHKNKIPCPYRNLPAHNPVTILTELSLTSKFRNAVITPVYKWAIRKTRNKTNLIIN